MIVACEKQDDKNTKDFEHNKIKRQITEQPHQNQRRLASDRQKRKLQFLNSSQQESYSGWAAASS